MENFLIYESNYGELATEIGATNIVGIYKTREEAERKREQLINEDFENDFVIDEKIKDDYINRDIVTMFYRYQENLNCYYEIIIKKVQVK